MTVQNRFEGKSVIVTGAASGIGRATALRLGEEGADVVLLDIDEEGLNSAAKILTDMDRQGHTRVVDLSQGSEACRAAIDFGVQKLGKLDVLCNIAGIAKARHFSDVTDAEWDRMMAINLSAVFFGSQAALPHLIATQGNIVNMSSTAALDGQIYNAVYCATKAGVLQMTKALAIELASKKVRVNAVCPGTVMTPLVENFELPEDPDMQLMSRMFSLLDPAQPEEIASAVAYLASDEARFVSGISFAIDGAQSAG